MVNLDIDSMILEGHLLRQIKNCVSFDFRYEKAASNYSYVGSLLGYSRSNRKQSLGFGIYLRREHIKIDSRN